MTGFFFSDFLKRNDAIYVRVCGSTVSNFALLLMAVLCPASHQAENGISRTNDNGDDYLSPMAHNLHLPSLTGEQTKLPFWLYRGGTGIFWVAIVIFRM